MDKTVIDLKNVSVCFKQYSAGSLTLKNKIYRLLTGKKVPAFTALKNVTVQIEEGETVGVIGKNGAGKSTLLRVMAQIIYPQQGESTVTRSVAPLFELGLGFHPELTGRENCYMAGALLGITPTQLDDVFENVMEFSELHDFVDQPIKTYSSGMYARLAFSLAVEISPEILLIDEVLGVGDEFFQKKCNARIQSMIKDGITTVIVSHNIDFLTEHCQRLLWLNHGEVVMDGIPAKVAADYRSEERTA